MVKKEPLFSWTIVFPIFYLTWFGFMQFIFHLSLWLKIVIICLLIILAAYLIIAGMVQQYRLNILRQQAVSGSSQELAREQPQSDAQALSLPVHIQHLPTNYSWLAVFYSSFSACVLVDVILLFIVFQDPFNLLFMLLFTFVIVLLWRLTVFYRSSQWLEISEDGLTLRTPFKKQTVLWKDALLFAIRSSQSSGRFSSSPKDYFELSSADCIVHWTLRSVVKAQFLQIKIASDVYQEQMQALLKVIAAKTELPLYDLRDSYIPYPTLIKPTPIKTFKERIGR